jgi:hypothetical protein
MFSSRIPNGSSHQFFLNLSVERHTNAENTSAVLGEFSNRGLVVPKNLNQIQHFDETFFQVVA